MGKSFADAVAEAATGRKMREIFAAEHTHRQWRRIWLAVATVQQQLGLPVENAQLDEIRERVDEVNYGYIALMEKELGPGPAAHLQALCAQCPRARNVLGAGISAEFILENGRALRLSAALLRLKSLLVNAIAALADFAEDSANLPGSPQLDAELTLGQLAALWLRDLLLELEALQRQSAALRLPGPLWPDEAALSALLGGNEAIESFSGLLAQELGFDQACSLRGPGYMERMERQALSLLARVADCADVAARQMLLLAANERLEWPQQSAGLPRRLSVISRYVINLSLPLPRSLWAGDDPALARAFCAADGMLALYINLIEDCRLRCEQPPQPAQVSLPFLCSVIDPLLAENKPLLGLDVGQGA